VAEVTVWPDVPAGERIALDGRLGGGGAPRRLRTHALRRFARLLLRRWPAPRPAVPFLYGRAAGVLPAPPPWITLPPMVRDALVLAPGASTPLKRWAPEHFAALGRRWEGPVVVVGSQAEASLVHQVAGAIAGAIPIADDGFDDAIQVFGAARVAVGGDSGLLHLAGACGAPLVALFGPTDPRDGFWVYPGEVVQRDLACRPCTRHRRQRCPLGHHACLRALTVDAVWAAVARVASAGDQSAQAPDTQVNVPSTVTKEIDPNPTVKST
jgi:hypothetical protein